MVLTPRPISAGLFRAYGRVLEAPADGVRLDFAAGLENRRPAARLNLALVRARPAPAVLDITEMERHPFSAQAFLPLDTRAYLAVVALDDGHGAPDPASLAAFAVAHPTGIEYGAGVWHIGVTTLGTPGTLALLVHEDGSPDDCHFRPVPPFRVLTGPLSR